MITTCPDCATQYEVDTALIPTTGRQVRCSACQAVWHAYVPADTPTIIDLAQGRAAPPSSQEYGAASGARFSRPTPQTPAASFSRPPGGGIRGQIGAQMGAQAAAVQFDLSDIEEQTISPDLSDFQKAAGWENAEEIDDIDDIDEIEDLDDDFADLWIKNDIEAALDPTEQDASPFHKELHGLKAALDEAGLTKSEPTKDVAVVQSDEATKPSETPTPEAAKPEGPILDQIPSEGDASRQIKQLKEAAQTLTRVGTALVTTRVKSFAKKPVRVPLLAGPAAPKEEKAELPAPEKMVAAYRKNLRWKAKNRLTPLRAMSWLMLLSILPALCFGAYHYSDEVMATVPQTKALYAKFGLVPVLPVELDDLSHRYAMSNEGPVVELRGVIRNNGKEAILAPQVAARTLAASGGVLSEFVIDIPVRALQPGMETPFIARVGVPDGVASVKMSVLDINEGTGAVTKFEGDGEETFFIQRTNSTWGQSPTPPIKD